MLATALPLLSSRFQLAVAFGVDLLLPPRQYILRCDVAGGAVQTNVIVAVHVAFDQMAPLFQRQRRSGPNALALQRFVPALNFSVRLRIERRSSDVRHARDPNELFEVLGDELRPVVRDDPWPRFRMLFFSHLQD